MRRSLKCLEALCIDVYVRRSITLTDPSPPVVEPVADAEADDGDWSLLESEVSRCERCELHKGRTQTVFGVGDKNAKWLLIGEAPGFEEDKQGEPFVGRAGQLLNRMLKAIGLSRSQVYIANTVKCRPPDNRNPKAEEIAACENYLQRQIELIQPQIILALGGVAANALLECDEPVGRLRGNVHHFRDSDIPLVVTYHPAYLLRSPNQKRAAWEDLQLAQRVLDSA